MKIGIYSDAHFSLNSSVLVGRDVNSTYSKRLSSLIASFDWMYRIFVENGVELIVSCGDLTDSDSLSAEESSALSEALSRNTSKIPEIHVLGNHELKDSEKNFTAINILSGYPHITVIKDYLVKSADNLDLVFVPYTSDNEQLNEIQNNLCLIDRDSIVFSHLVYLSDELLQKNGFLGIQGVDKDVICSNSKVRYIFNGHIHNPVKCGNYVQVGSLIGNGFGDNYEECLPRIIILDTDLCAYRSFENPYSVLFYKLNCRSLSEFSKKFQKRKQRCCLQVTSPIGLREALSQFLTANKESLNLLEFRIRSEAVSAESIIEDESELNYLNEKIDKLTDNKSVKELISLFIQQSESLPCSEVEMLNFVGAYFKD